MTMSTKRQKLSNWIGVNPKICRFVHPNPIRFKVQKSMSNQPCQLVLRLYNDHSLYNNHNNNEIYASHALSQETKYTPQNISPFAVTSKSV